MAAKGAKLPGWQKAALGMGAESPQPEAERRARTCSVQPDPKGNALKKSAALGKIGLVWGALMGELL